MVEMTFEMTEEIEDRLNEIARRHDVPIGKQSGPPLVTLVIGFHFPSSKRN